MTMGSAPSTRRTSPSSATSPMNAMLSESKFICLPALSRAMRIGRSYTEPSLRVSAGARFTVMRLTGKANPVFFIAERTLFFASLIAASGSPTISNLGSPCERSAST